MIDLIQETHDCPCAECRARRHGILRRYQKQIPKAAIRGKRLPVRRPKALQSVCSASFPACRKSPSFAASTGQVSNVISTIGFPACIPINFYPIDNSPSVQHAMQFLHEVFLMSIHPHVDVPEGWKPILFWTEKMSHAIKDPVWFHSTIAFAEAMKQKTIVGSSRNSAAVMKHSAKALAGLRDRIATGGDGIDDYAILTITSLMSADIVTRNVKLWKAHIEGLDRILALRGGFDALHTNEYVRHKVIGFQLFWLYKQMSLGTTPEFATYPRHPFSPELCLTISKMPDDLAELALDGCLNIDLIKMMEPVLALASKMAAEGQKRREDMRRMKCLAYELEELFSITDLSQNELLLVMALIDFCITLDEGRKQHWLLVGSCQINCSRLLFTGIEYDPCRHDLLVWLGAMFVAAGEPTLQSARLGQKILNRCGRERQIDRAAVLSACQKIAWDEILTEKLDTRFDFDAASSAGSISLTATPEYRSASPTASPEPEAVP